MNNNQADAIIIGGGASGLMCAYTASKLGKKVLVLDHQPRLGNRVAISGGGRCNFSNRSISPDDYVCSNKRFLYSPLQAFTPADAISFFTELGLGYEERERGQLFCSQRGDALRQALIEACLKMGVEMLTQALINQAEAGIDGGFVIDTNKGSFHGTHLIVATGGLSYAKLGASDLGYRLAKQFGHRILPTSPGLVPLLYAPEQRDKWRSLAGISLPITCTLGKNHFEGDLLFTHQGLSGPVMLTVSNHWQNGEVILIDWMPGKDLGRLLASAKASDNAQSILAKNLPKRFLGTLFNDQTLQKPLAQLSRLAKETIIATCKYWSMTPQKTDGYEKAEVTKGGVDTREIDGKTMQSLIIPGLFFIGEVLDVTGNLGGYNLHWAWTSGHLAGSSL